MITYFAALNVLAFAITFSVAINGSTPQGIGDVQYPSSVNIVNSELADISLLRGGGKAKGKGWNRKLQAPYYVTTSSQVLGAANPDATIGNPLKGLMGSPKWKQPPYQDSLPTALEFYYIGLDEILVGESQYDWTIFEGLLEDSASRNQHVVPRIYIHYPGRTLKLPPFLLDSIDLREYTDMGGGLSPYYGDSILLQALEEFISEFGVKYDGDQRIGFIQMGLLGFWGEWHTLDNPFIPASTKDDVVAWFDAAFDVTPLQTRYPLQSAYEAGIGLHDDSFAYNTLDGEANGGEFRSWFFWPRVLNAGHEDFWKTAPMGGETRPEIQSIIFSRIIPQGTMNVKTLMFVPK
jgi:hypothetical protein